MLAIFLMAIAVIYHVALAPGLTKSNPDEVNIGVNAGLHAVAALTLPPRVARSARAVPRRRRAPAR